MHHLAVLDTGKARAARLPAGPRCPRPWPSATLSVPPEHAPGAGPLHAYATPPIHLASVASLMIQTLHTIQTLSTGKAITQGRRLRRPQPHLFPSVLSSPPGVPCNTGPLPTTAPLSRECSVGPRRVNQRPGEEGTGAHRQGRCIQRPRSGAGTQRPNTPRKTLKRGSNAPFEPAARSLWPLTVLARWLTFCAGGCGSPL